MTDNYYNLSASFGLVSGFWIVYHYWKKSGESITTAVTLLTIGAPLIFVGAKIGHLLQAGHSLTLLNIGHGYSLYGAFLAVLLFWIFVRLFWRFPFFHFLDCETLAAAVGLIFARLGCFFNGCCGGIPTELPWAVTFPRETAVYTQQLLAGVIAPTRVFSLPVHPTQLYEIGIGILVTFLSIWWLSRNLKPGAVFAVGVFIYSSFRLSSDYLRNDYLSTVWGMFSINQLISLYLVLGSLIFFFWKRVEKGDTHELAP